MLVEPDTSEQPHCGGAIDRVDINKITVEEFLERYERASRPCILTGAAEIWPANKRWRVCELLRSYGDSLFKCGESDNGRKLKVTLKEYLEYALYNRDDSPLYCFEASLEEHPQAHEMLKDYSPPAVLKEDLFTDLVSGNCQLSDTLTS